MIRLANRFDHVAPSPLVAQADSIVKLRAAGRPVIDLGIGEPDFDTSEPIKAAATAAMTRGATKYTPMGGTAEVRAAIAEKFLDENGLRYRPDQIVVSNGVKQVLFNACMATLNGGDEVIVPAPYWMSYPSIVSMAGGEPVIVPCSAQDGFKLQPDALERALTRRSRWLLLNSPNNPSGAVYSAAELSALAEVLLPHGAVGVLSDDIYEHIRVDQAPMPTMASVEPRLFERTLTANGLSKAYAMTGWRVGYAGGPSALIRAMIEVQAQSTSAPNSIAQAAAVAALRGSQDHVRARAQVFVERSKRLSALLGRIPNLEFTSPAGSFYAFVGCERLIGRKTFRGKVLQSDVDIASWLLDDHFVAVLPGTAFGASPYVRLSFATAMETLEEACQRIALACAEIG